MGKNTMQLRAKWASIGAPPPPSPPMVSPPPVVSWWVLGPPPRGSWSVVHGLGFRGLGLSIRVQDFHSGPLVHCGFRV